MNDVIEEALGNLTVRIEQTGARVLFDRLPSVVGEPASNSFNCFRI